MIKPKWTVFEDAQKVAQAAAQHVLTTAEAAIAERGVFKLVLAGGSTPQITYRQLVSQSADWGKWQIFFGDERCLPSHDPNRNSYMAANAWLAHVPIPAKQIHPIPVELGASEGAARYSELISKVLPFDLVILGLGEDGHTASLFPDQIPVNDSLVCPVVSAPKPPSQRVSLTFKALNDTWHTLVLVTGTSKREAVYGWRAGHSFPINQITSRNDYQVFADQVATDGS